MIDKKGVGNKKAHSFISNKGGSMKEKVTMLIQDAISSLHLVVSDVYYSEDEGIKTLNIELDSEQTIDVDTITAATEIINPIIDSNHLADDIDVLDIHSRSKGDDTNER